MNSNFDNVVLRQDHGSGAGSGSGVGFGAGSIDWPLSAASKKRKRYTAQCAPHLKPTDLSWVRKRRALEGAMGNCKPVDDDDRKLPARREVPCASPPMNKDGKGENEEDDDKLEFGIVMDLAVKYGLVCATPEEAMEMINFVIDHGQEIRIVPPNLQLADKINKIGKGLLQTKKINRYSNDPVAMCRITTTDRAFVSTWARPTNNTIVSNAHNVKAVVDMSLNQSLRATFRKDVDRMRQCQTGLVKGSFILAHLIKESVPPFVADLIPGTLRTEDFDGKR